MFFVVVFFHVESNKQRLVRDMLDNTLLTSICWFSAGCCLIHFVWSSASAIYPIYHISQSVLLPLKVISIWYTREHHPLSYWMSSQKTFSLFSYTCSTAMLMEYHCQVLRHLQPQRWQIRVQHICTGLAPQWLLLMTFNLEERLHHVKFPLYCGKYGTQKYDLLWKKFEKFD